MWQRGWLLSIVSLIIDQGVIFLRDVENSRQIFWWRQKQLNPASLASLHQPRGTEPIELSVKAISNNAAFGLT
jgi:hypothetical protein